MLHTAVQVAQETAEHSTGGISPIVLGLLAFGGLFAGLLVTYAFRNVNNRH